MAEAIRMPLLSDTMKEGVIAAWHKKVGDTVSADEAIADVETDKATMEVLPYVDGTLLYIGVEQGKAAQVNQIIAIIGKAGEDFQHLLDNNTPTVEKTEQPKEEKQAESSAPKAQTAPIPKDVTIVRMPLLSDTMKEGKIVAWHKNVGDQVSSDDALADVETDKATMEVMGYADGTLLYQGIKAGEAAKINEIIAIVGKAGTDITGILALEGQESNPQEAATETAPQTQSNTATSQVTNSNLSNDKPESGDDRVKISPLAKKLAKEKNIDLNSLKGSGDNGRIVKRDIENYQPNTKANTTTHSAATITSGSEGYSDTPVSQMRNVIARRLAESKYSAPHFYLNISVKMDEAMAARAAINKVSPNKVSFNDMIVKVCAMALRKHPEVNSSWLGDKIRTYNHVHIGTAVAVDEGLLVPVIKFADQKGLSEIAANSNELIEKARNKKLQPSEFSGNTFTISNLGMMDIDSFTAIINPPDAAILAVGKIEPTPVVENNEIVIRNIMKLTLSCDHRVVDGAVGARFLQTLKTYLENPVTMLV